MRTLSLLLVLVVLAPPHLHAQATPGFAGLTGAVGGSVFGMAKPGDAPKPKPRPRPRRDDGGEGAPWVDIPVDRSGWYLNNRVTLRYRLRGKDRKWSFGSSTVDKLVDALQRIRRVGGRVTTLEIKGHAAPELQQMGGGTFLIATNGQILATMKDERQVDLTRLFRQTLAADARVDLNGCQTGRGEDPIALEMSLALPGRTVTGGRGLAQAGVPFTSKAVGARRHFKDGEEVASTYITVD